jgi:hypothetical protein
VSTRSKCNTCAVAAAALHLRLPRTILGGGVNESMSLSIPPQTLNCGARLGMQTFVPRNMVDPNQRPLGDTAWLDLANPKARDYYLCVGTELIDRGYTLIGFPEHENVIAHASSGSEAIKNFVYVMDELRRYGAAEGKRIYFSGDPAEDDTAKHLGR